MAQGAEEAIVALRRLHDELVGLVQGLDAEELLRQSGSSEWTIAQVLSHLGSAAEIGLNTLTAGKADMAGAQAVWDRWNAMSPGEQATGFVVASERLVEGFEGLDEAALSTKKVDVGFLPAPVDIAFLVGMRSSEVGLHRWDVEVAFDSSAVVADYVVPFLLDILPVFAGFFAKPIGRSGQVAIVTVEPTRHYLLELGDAGGSLSEGSGTDPQTRLQISAEALLRLTSGRLGPEHTPASVTVEGEFSLEELRRVFPRVLIRPVEARSAIDI